jgi:hypothetical protein
MKFSNKLDLELFLTEVDRLDLIGTANESFEPSQDLLELFIKRRKPLVGAIKDFRRSQKTKEQWREHRWKFMRGMKRFHNSVKGKRFHRNMGRFLSTRYFHPRLKSMVKDDQETMQGSRMKEGLNIYDLAEILKAINSAKTHLFIELERYFPLQEEIEYWEMLDEILPSLDRVEKKLWLGEELGSADLETLMRITEKHEMSKCISESCKVECKKVEDLWNEFESKNQDRLDEDILATELIDFIKESLKQDNAALNEKEAQNAGNNNRKLAEKLQLEAHQTA